MIAGLALLAIQACVSCHKPQGLSQPRTPMGQALVPAKDSPWLKSAGILRFTGGGFSYVIAREGEKLTYSVADKHSTISVPLMWAAGYGTTGQTYLFQRDGAWYESATSYFPALKGLDWTPGHADRSRRNLDEALGRRLDSREAQRCFGCHSTGSQWSERGQLVSLQAGIGCAQCHVDADAHARSFDTRSKSQITSLGSLPAEELSGICSRCHPSWAEIAADGPRGPANVRHQIYRLTGSLCYDTSDARISCAACHDVHRHEARQVNFYDSKCQACHSSGKHCKVASSGCTGCHMPKVEAPGLHFAFTDHRIRIARSGAAYPD